MLIMSYLLAVAVCANVNQKLCILSNSSPQLFFYWLLQVILVVTNIIIEVVCMVVSLPRFKINTNYCIIGHVEFEKFQNF